MDINTSVLLSVAEVLKKNTSKNCGTINKCIKGSLNMKYGYFKLKFLACNFTF